MKKIKNESGRSVLEVIAVIAIILVLTLASLGGYSFLMKRYRRQEAVKDVVQLVTSIKTAGRLDRYSQPDKRVLKAGSFVKGPEITGDGVLKLADSETSFVVVTGLKNDAFAVHLQAEPETCEAVLNALSDDEIMMFEPVGQSNSAISSAAEFADAAEDWANEDHTGTEDDENSDFGVRYHSASGDGAISLRRQQLIDACNHTDTNLIGRAAFIFQCNEGGSVAGNITDYNCSSCVSQGLMKDAGSDRCCDPEDANRCGVYCSCPTGTVCDKSGADRVNGQCVECNEDSDCNQFNLFSKKACFENKCVECTDDTHCAAGAILANHTDKELYENKNLRYCAAEHKCIECESNFNSNKDFSCLEDKPVCMYGTCEGCPEGQHYNSETFKCECEGDVASYTNDSGVTSCAKCFDTAAGNVADLGCESDPSTPICTDDAYKLFDGGTKAAGTQCVQCLQDSDCSNGTSCFNHTCVKCIDNNDGEETDGGCDMKVCDGVAASMCKPDEDSKGNNTGKTGSGCYVCKNNNYGADEKKRDYGCPEEKPACEAGEDEYGNSCSVIYTCQDTKTGVGYDEGCDDQSKKTPMCVLGSNDAGWVNDGQGTKGDRCAQCKGNDDCKNLFGSGVNDKKLCDGSEHICRVCKNDQPGSATDIGCSEADGKPFCQAAAGEWGTACAQCINDKEAFGEVDTGCSSDKPHCNAVFGQYGTCKVKPLCLDDKTDSNDTGCPAVTPFCVNKALNIFKNEGQGQEGDACVECLTNDDCTGNNKFCNLNANDPQYHMCTKCVRTDEEVDTGCDAETPVCRKDGMDILVGAYGNQCTKKDFCFDTETGMNKDSGCEEYENQPLCVAPNATPAYWGNEGKGQGGTSCVQCRSENGGDADCKALSDAGVFGAGEQRELCQSDNKCYKCKNDKDGMEQDTGCSANTPICKTADGLSFNAEADGVLSNWCMAAPACVDTRSDTEQDLGCTQRKHPFCVAPDASPAYWGNEGANAVGTTCVTCRSEATQADNEDCKGVWAAVRSEGQEDRHVCYHKPDKQRVDNICVHCVNDKTGNQQDTGCSKSKPMCGAESGGYSNAACGSCVNDKPGIEQDTGCSADKPVCVGNDGKINMTADIREVGTKCVTSVDNKHCLSADRKTIVTLSEYDDIFRDENGMCKCYAWVASNSVNESNSLNVGDWDKTCWRRTHTRQRKYEVTGNFYCTRYFRADGQADDDVVYSVPPGISTEGKHRYWGGGAQAHDNSISQKNSQATLKGKNQTGKLVITDRWLQETGYTGRFYFGHADSVTPMDISVGWFSPKRLPVRAGWEKTGAVGPWMCKDGVKGCSCKAGETKSTISSGGRTCFYAPGYKGNCNWPSGRRMVYCFTRTWAASATPKAKCSISSDKHTVTAKDGFCNADFVDC